MVDLVSRIGARRVSKFSARPTLSHVRYHVDSLHPPPHHLDRVSELLRGAAGHAEVHGILNAEDEVYIAAVLGCTMDIARDPLRGERPGGDPDLSFSGPRQLKRRMDEVVRAIRWQRLAAPFPAGMGSGTHKDVLIDDWLFRRGETWSTESIGHQTKQGAPAGISRNLNLPEVEERAAKNLLSSPRVFQTAPLP